jgi:putative SOS response-associated peptidase YedK
MKFNARSESVTEKPVFSRLLQRQRCVVLLDGFYEWKADAGGKKQPYYVSFGEGNVMRMAGLYDMWTGGRYRIMVVFAVAVIPSCALCLSWQNTARVLGFGCVSSALRGAA